MKDLIGKKVRGFKFESNKYDGLPYAIEMDNHIGEIGTIKEKHHSRNIYTVQFKSDWWSYPASLIEQHLVEEETGSKETKDKLSYELDFEFIKQMAERMQVNKGKYEPYNWKKPIDVESLKQALFRHVLEVMNGNYEDDGRLEGHLEAIALNSMMINYQIKNNKND